MVAYERFDCTVKYSVELLIKDNQVQLLSTFRVNMLEVNN